jgi:FxLD family lantipeptide
MVTAQLHEPPGLSLDEFELDITIVESGPEADRLIRMTDDGCTSTCASACAGSC